MIKKLKKGHCEYCGTYFMIDTDNTDNESMCPKCQEILKNVTIEQLEEIYGKSFAAENNCNK